MSDEPKSTVADVSSTVTTPEIDARFVAAIVDVLGDTDQGLRGSEIAAALRYSDIPNEAPSYGKKRQLHESLGTCLRKPNGREKIRKFVAYVMSRACLSKGDNRFEHLGKSLKQALLLLGCEVDEGGTLRRTRPARTIEEAHRRTADLRQALEGRQVHQMVLEYCREELVQNNYFHAVFEAVKGLFERIRDITGIKEDGTELVKKSLEGNAPALRINALATDAEIMEQRGFASLLKGVYGMFHNPLAHEPKVTWEITKEDSLDLFSLLSLVHRRLDRADQFCSAEAPRSGPTTTDDGR